MKLSIIIAAYNVERFIAKCVASCYDEAHNVFYEIVLVDDGSNDNTVEIVRKLQVEYKNLKLIEKVNEGLGAARNTGIKAAAGDYIWMIDGDDFLQPGIVQSVLNEIDRHKADMYCTNYQVTDISGKVLSVAYPDGYITKESTGAKYYLNNTERNYTWQYIFKRALFIDHHICFKAKINMQDSEILPRILFHVKSVRYIDQIGYNYVQYAGSFTNTQNPEKRYRYFQSIIEVKNSLSGFAEKIQTLNPTLYQGIIKKVTSLDMIVFNHLVFFRYRKEDLQRVLQLLEKNDFYPLRAQVSGKMKALKWMLNYLPFTTNFVLSFFRK